MTPAERDMVTVARALFDRNANVITGLLRRTAQTDIALGWSRRTIDAMVEAIRKGTVRWIGRHGATPRTYFRDGEGQNGRAWERMDDPSLVFTDLSRRAIVALVSQGFAKSTKDQLLRVRGGEGTIGDELVLGRVGRMAMACGNNAFLEHPAMEQSLLVRLFCAERLHASPPPKAAAITRWTSGLGADLMVTLSDELAEAWVYQEGRLAAGSSPEIVRTIGKGRADVLDPMILSALDKGRPDVMTFLLVAMGKLVPPESEPWDMAKSIWTNRIGGGTLALRSAARQALLATPNALLRLFADARAARGTGFVDDDWEKAKARAAFYNKYDHGRFARIEALVTHINSVNWAEP